MKKYIALLLIFAICFSFAGCGDASSDTSAKIWLKKTDEYHTLCFENEKAFRECITEVKLNRDNWDKYFGNIEEVEHVVQTNDLGEIESEYDDYYFGFGLKDGVVAYYDSVSFKFDGATNYEINYNMYSQIESITYSIHKMDLPTYKVYDYYTKNLITEETKAETVDYYSTTLIKNKPVNSNHYAEHKCVSATGSIYVFNLPEGVYNGENLIDYIIIESYGPVYADQFDEILYN